MDAIHKIGSCGCSVILLAIVVAICLKACSAGAAVPENLFEVVPGIEQKFNVNHAWSKVSTNNAVVVECAQWCFGEDIGFESVNEISSAFPAYLERKYGMKFISQESKSPCREEYSLLWNDNRDTERRYLVFDYGILDGKCYAYFQISQSRCMIPVRRVSTVDTPSPTGINR